MTIGIVVVASLAARVSCRTARDDHVYLETHKFGRARSRSFLRASILNDDVFPLHVTELAQSLSEYAADAGLAESWRARLGILSEWTFVACCAGRRATSVNEHGANAEKNPWSHLFLPWSPRLTTASPLAPVYLIT